MTDDNGRASLKSPEELALENESLRASLDAMAVHTHEVERANRALLEQMEERQKMIRALADGVRREAYRAKQGHDLMRSQLLASQVSPAPGSGPSTDLVKRLRVSEQETERLQTENDKLVGALTITYLHQLIHIRRGLRYNGIAIEWVSFADLAILITPV